MEEKEKRGSTGLALKAGIWYVISNFLVKAMAFITTPIFARLMSEADYGEFSNYASWQSTLLIITGAELHNTLSRAYYDYTDDYDKYISSVTVASCLLTLVVYGLFLLCQGWIYSIVAIPPAFVHVLFFTLMCQSCKTIWLARERTLYRYKSVALVSMLNLVVPTLIAVALVILLPVERRLGARIYGTYVPMAAIGLICAITMLCRGRSFHLDHVKYAFKLSLPLLVHFLTVSLLTSSNTIVTKSVLGANAAAAVSIVTSAIHIFTILLQAVSGAMTTWMMDNLELKKMDQVRKGTLLYVVGICAIACGAMLLGPELIWILGGAKYADAVTLVPGMVTAALIQSMTTVFTIILTYKKQVVQTAVYTAVVAGLSIGAKVLILEQWGLSVLPMVNIVAFGTLYVVNWLLVRRTDCAAAIHDRVFFGMILMTGAVMLLCGFLYENLLLRYGIIGLCAAAVLAVGWKYRALLMKLVRSRLKKKTS